MTLRNLRDRVARIVRHPLTLAAAAFVARGIATVLFVAWTFAPLALVFLGASLLWGSAVAYVVVGALAWLDNYIPTGADRSAWRAAPRKTDAEE